MFLIIISVFSCIFINDIYGFPEQGKWSANMNEIITKHFFVKNVFNNTEVIIKINCDTNNELEISVDWLLRYTPCSDNYNELSDLDAAGFYDHPELFYTNENFVKFQRSPPVTCPCLYPIMLQEDTKLNWTEVVNIFPTTAAPAVTEKPDVEKGNAAGSSRKKREIVVDPSAVKTKTLTDLADPTEEAKKNNHVVSHIPESGTYLLIIHIVGVNKSSPQEDVSKYTISLEVEMLSRRGYLSASDWPLLVFYGVMCGVYVIFGLVWLIVSALQWRDLLRVQFWIGGVILLGMVEKAVFYAEYQNLNSTGELLKGAVFFAEIVSVLKRTLARMLVIIVSLGFGIVKPRLGTMLHRVLGIGVLYFIVGTIEACMRTLQKRHDASGKTLLAIIPVAVVDSVICWWVFSSLVQTLRTLRLRRNLVKLSLYRHFTNTLIFTVGAAIIFMAWSMKSHKFVECLTDWQELWIDEAYWHLLFSIILLVIMILWRPTNNNQRYAFSPLMDSAEDEEAEEPMLNEAFEGMKMRNVDSGKRNGPSKGNDDDDPLKWIEENIPASLVDTALPSLLDSDEEVMTTKFEVSKMQ